MTREEKNEIIQGVIEAIKAQSQDISELPSSNNIEEIKTLPILTKGGVLKSISMDAFKQALMDIMPSSESNSTPAILPFEDFVENVSHTAYSAASGDVVFDTRNNVFLCKTGSDYCPSWAGMEEYGTQTNEGVKPRGGVIFYHSQSGKAFTWKDGNLKALLSASEAIDTSAIEKKADDAKKVADEAKAQADTNKNSIASMVISGGLPIVQETGNSRTSVMSQEAVTEALKHVEAITDDGKTLQDVYSELVRNTYLADGEEIVSCTDTMESNFALNVNGDVVAKTLWKTTKEYVSLNGAYKVHIVAYGGDRNVSFVCFYDAEKKLIDSSYAQPATYTADIEIPTDAKYVRFCSTGSPIVELHKKKFINLADSVKRSEGEVKRIGDRFVLKRDIPDYDFYRQSSAEGMLTYTGQVKNNAAWEYTPDFLDLENVTKIVVTSAGSGASLVAFYNKDKVFISGITKALNGEVVTPPANAKYARFCFGWKRGSAIISSHQLFPLDNYVLDNVTKVGEYSDEVNINNVDALLVEGSSLTASIACPAGFGWLSKMNDLVDIAIVNDGRPSKKRTDNLNSVANGETLNISKSSIASLNAKYLFLINSANGTSVGLEGYEELERAKIIAQTKGMSLLLGDEEWGNAEHTQCISSFGAQHNTPIPNSISELAKKLSTGYSGLKVSNHGGWRTISCYAPLQEFIEALPINRGIKLFRVRPEVSIANVNELAFDTNEQRAIKWKAIQAGQDTIIANLGGRKPTFNAADNLDKTDATFDTNASYMEDTDNTSEVANLLAGGALTFKGYSLLQFSLNAKKISTCHITLKTDKALTAKILMFDAKSTTSVYHKYVDVNSDYADGVLNIDIDNLSNAIYDSKVSIILHNDEEYKISSPSCRYCGIKKDERAISYQQRKKGTECFASTSIDDVVVTGATIITPPADLLLKTTYNTSQKVAKLSANSDSISKQFNNASEKVAIRVVAQNFYKYATTRFSGAEYSEYVTTEHIGLEPNSYDYGNIIVSVDGCIQKKLVWSGWTEVYCEFELPKGNHTLKIQRNNVGNTPILIHDISVQNI